MKPLKLLLITLATAVGTWAPPLRAAEADPAQERLRSELRDMILQLRSVQSDLAAAQSQVAAARDEKSALQAKYDILRKEAAANAKLSASTAGDLQTQLVALKIENAKLAAALGKARSEGEKSAQDAEAARTTGAGFRSETIVLHRKVSDLESRNLALFLTANEILTRYQEYSLGHALIAKEPFIGATRTRLENLIQDYQDKLSAERAHN
jgi:chromosome segregation ATPase